LLIYDIALRIIEKGSDMPKSPQLTVEPRTLVGHRVNQLRHQGKIPANIYGNKIKSVSVQIEWATFAKLYSQIGETTLLELSVSGEPKSRHALISQLQRHPVTGKVLHIDFHQVALTEKVTATIPLEYLGEAPAVKEQGGILVHVISDLKVEALPTELPDKFTVDLSKLKAIGDSLTLKDLGIDRAKFNMSLDDDSTIVTIQAPKEEEVEVAPIEAAATVTEAAPVEGEAPAPADPKATDKAAPAKSETKK
jgi:large subunit ribosomal protein L25